MTEKIRRIIGKERKLFRLRSLYATENEKVVSHVTKKEKSYFASSFILLQQNSQELCFLLVFKVLSRV
jgi:hypothetical protein